MNGVGIAVYCYPPTFSPDFSYNKSSFDFKALERDVLHQALRVPQRLFFSDMTRNTLSLAKPSPANVAYPVFSLPLLLATSQSSKPVTICKCVGPTVISNFVKDAMRAVHIVTPKLLWLHETIPDVVTPCLLSIFEIPSVSTS